MTDIVRPITSYVILIVINDSNYLLALKQGASVVQFIRDAMHTEIVHVIIITLHPEFEYLMKAYCYNR